jgi:outer membrane lipoprotein-sorting protein
LTALARRLFTGILYLTQVSFVINPLFGNQDRSSQLEKPKAAKEGGDELLLRIWTGVQEAQKRYSTGCGTITEVRTSKLLIRPLTFRGKFCASGTDKFQLEYTEPEPIRLVFDHKYLNVTTGIKKKITEVLDIGDAVSRVQRYFSAGDSLKNIRKSFIAEIEESPDFYTMKLLPRSRQFIQRVNYVVVVLGKRDFLLKKLEVDGKGGVNSVFSIDIDALNTEINDDVFRVIKP